MIPLTAAEARRLFNLHTLYRFKTNRMCLTWGFIRSANAARWYSLITPPSTFRR